MLARSVLIPSIALAAALITACSGEDRAERYLERGTALYEQGDLVKARLELQNVLQIDPKDAEAWFLLAKIAEQQENWRGAFSAYQKTVELSPDNAEARIELGTLMLASNSPDEALAQAEAVLAANAEDPAALALRGSVRLRQGDPNAALRDAESALMQDPSNREALALQARVQLQRRDLPGAEQSLKSAVEAHPDDLRLLLGLASVSEQLGDTAGAVSVLRQIIEREPKVLAHRTRLAQYLAAHGDRAAAEQVLRQAVADLPDDDDAKLTLVALIQAQQGAAAATEQLQAFIEAAPDDNALRFALAARRSVAGETEQAEAIYREIIARADGGPDGLRARAKLAALAFAQGRQDEARTLVGEVLDNNPEDADALLVRAALALHGDGEAGSDVGPDAEADGANAFDPQQAIADLRTILRDNPESTAALRLLAMAHQARNEPALAEDALERLIELAPDDPAGYLQLAGLRSRIGDVEGATLALDELLGRDPGSALAQTALARIQQQQPDTDALEETAGLVLKTRPEHPLGHYLSGLVDQRRGELEASVAPLLTALEKNPKAAQPLVALTRSLLGLGRYDDAERHLREALKAGADEIVATNLLGEVYVAAGRPDEARAQYREAIALRPGAPLAYQRLADLQRAAGEADAAVTTLRSGIEATKGSPLLSTALPLALEEAGRVDEAVDAYEGILAANPDADWAANNLAMLLADHRADDPVSLERALTLALRFADSDQPAFLDTLGWVYYRKGEYTRAAELLEQAHSAGEPTPQRQFHLGMTYLALGRAEDAKALLSAAVEAGRPFAGLDEARAALAGL
ncbi:Tfp pilus assembly protein PilF [Thioflavicoccus mobilis 8321]|uniref:Tfp pilus assembly protein PilF n=1 Tax=Thioflavicoccus mobilis 8321 TaxID=765912 RepID=L0H140_9GAMM|nr:tetratricopeptide repeat protein [Thioflavicoccus mobilis]AGA91777.1 Tfp pilus assembly protein PilF [Thioflavicoccus mobilis 8321]